MKIEINLSLKFGVNLVVEFYKCVNLIILTTFY